MKIAVIQNTHGDEINGLHFPSFVDVFVGNPQAKEKGVRFIESDLNRSFNGKTDTIEERRAVELKKILSPYDFVLDIHSTISGKTNAVISTKLTSLEWHVGRKLAENFIYFPLMTNSLIHHVKNGVALELGGKEDLGVYQQAIDNLLKIFFSNDLPIDRCKKAWHCFDSEKKKDGYLSLLKNYDHVKNGDVVAINLNGEHPKAIVAVEEFTTFLWGNNQYDDIYGFKLKKLFYQPRD